MGRRWRWALAVLAVVVTGGWPMVARSDGQPSLMSLALTINDLPRHTVQVGSNSRAAYADTQVLLAQRSDYYDVTFQRPLQVGVVTVGVQLHLFQSHQQAVSAIAETVAVLNDLTHVLTPTALRVGDKRQGFVVSTLIGGACKTTLYGVVGFSRGPYAVSLQVSDCMGQQALMPAQRQEATRLMSHVVQWARIMDGRMKRVKNPRVLDVYGPAPVAYPTATPVPALIYSIGSSSRGQVAQIDVTALHGAACVLMFVYKDGTIETLAPTSRRASFMRGYDIQTIRWTPKTSEHGGAQGWVTCVLGSRSQTMKL
jgi:hypothetical protein